MIAPVVMSLVAALAQASPATPPPRVRRGSGRSSCAQKPRAPRCPGRDRARRPALYGLPHGPRRGRGSRPPRSPAARHRARHRLRPHRETARQRADAILRRIGGRSADERSAYIERTLASMEAFLRAARARAAAREQDDLPIEVRPVTSADAPGLAALLNGDHRVRRHDRARTGLHARAARRDLSRPGRTCSPAWSRSIARRGGSKASRP